MVNLTIVLSEEAARALHAGSSDHPSVAEIARVVEASGGRLAPMHSATADAGLHRYASVHVPDRAHANRLLQKLHGLSSVESVYEKPADEPP